MRWLDGITDSMGMSLSKLWELWWTGRPGVLQSITKSRTRLSDWSTTTVVQMLVLIVLQSPRRMLMVDPWGAWKRTETADWPPGGAAPPAGTAPEQAGSSGLTGALCGLQHLGSCGPPKRVFFTGALGMPDFSLPRLRFWLGVRRHDPYVFLKLEWF